MVSGTLSSGKWHIILWEKKVIPSGNWTRGNWNTTVIFIGQKHTGEFTKTERHKETKKDRQTERQKDRKAERQKDRKTERQ